MLTSGQSPVATGGTDPVVLIPAGGLFNRLVVVNEGSAAGFLSPDGGQTWARLPAATPPYSGAGQAIPAVVEWWGRSQSGVLVKRAGGADLSGVYAYADFLG